MTDAASFETRCWEQRHVLRRITCDQYQGGGRTMKEYEARCLVEQWVKDFSPFKATVVAVRPERDDN